MSQLQKLLDERWRLHGELSETDLNTMRMFRLIFEEGYNAAKEEIKQRPEVDIDDLEARYNQNGTIQTITLLNKDLQNV